MYRQFHAERTSRIQNYDSAYVQNNKKQEYEGEWKKKQNQKIFNFIHFNFFSYHL